MAFKDILVQLDGSSRSEARLAVALALAAAYQAHLTAVNIRGRTITPAMVTAQFGAAMDSILAQGDEEAAARAKALVDAGSERSSVPVEWRDVVGDPVQTLALHARYCDLLVLGQSAPHDSDSRALVDELLTMVGRPILVVPYAGYFPTVGRRVLVGWNGSREATRAIHDALPILVAAERVHVIAVNPGHGMSGHGDIPGADICLHLSRHGVNAVCEHLRSDEVDAAAMLLNRAADEDCDLMVMGGYGHSRLREMVLGGVTRHLLEHMTVPVLLSH